MILLTVGTQLPFDRLVSAVDELAADFDEPFVAQIGRGAVVPRHMEWHRVIDPMAFEELLSSARLIVAHAGIGTILTARKMRKPLVLFPRLASLGEHRNDHQLATTVALANRPGIAVATRPDLLRSCIEAPPGPPEPLNMADKGRQNTLCQAIERFIEAGLAAGGGNDGP